MPSVFDRDAELQPIAEIARRWKCHPVTVRRQLPELFRLGIAQRPSPRLIRIHVERFRQYREDITRQQTDAA